MSKILIINGPNLNLLGEREQSQYGKEDYKYLEDICLKRSKELNLALELKQSNLEGEIVNIIQEARNDIDGIDCFRSIDDALQSCEGNVWFIGGSGIYEEAMDNAEIIEISLICAMFNMINRLNDSLDLTIEDQPEIDKIKGSLHIDPKNIKTYLHWLADQ